MEENLKTTPVDRKIRILVVPSDRTGVGYFRSVKPHIMLEKQFPNEFKVDIDYSPKYDNDEYLKQYDIIHYHRGLGPFDKMVETAERLKRLGVIGIMDMDDYWSPGSHHPAYLIIQKNKLPEKITSNLRLAQYVTTTTDIFKKEIEKYNKNVFVLPNGVDPKEPQFTPTLNKTDRIRIGWLGSSSHLNDLQILNGIVTKLKFDNLLHKVQFVLCGYDLRGTITMIDEKTGEQKQRKITPQESFWCKYEQIFTENYGVVSPEYREFLLKFKNEEYPDLDNEPYRRVWTKPITSYANNYNLFDISLAPLEENTFNKMKSNLKAVEAGIHKKALIAQDFGPYQIDLINAFEGNGKEINKNGNALLVPSIKNHKLWYQHIKRLVENPELIDMLSENLNKLIMEKYSLDGDLTKRRADLYKNLINI